MNLTPEMIEAGMKDGHDPVHTEWVSGADYEAATRRAITMAAAEIGKKCSPEHNVWKLHGRPLQAPPLHVALCSGNADRAPGCADCGLVQGQALMILTQSELAKKKPPGSEHLRATALQPNEETRPQARGAALLYHRMTVTAKA